MARADALGLFWRDEPKVKIAKAPPPKRTPPPRTWESPDYLPHLEEALAFNVPLMTDAELYHAYLTRDKFDWDTECYTNYWLAAFTSQNTGKVFYMEIYEDDRTNFDARKLQWCLENLRIAGFNSKKYDETMTLLALNGQTNLQLKQASDAMIVQEMPGYEILRAKRIKKIKTDHVDLIEVAPSFCSLKLYAGRMHSKRMQDLPFNPSTVLTPNQVAVLRLYCCTDLMHTQELRSFLLPQIKLRETIGAEHGDDFRSKSDAQIAEAVIASELQRMGIPRPTKPTIAPGTSYWYQVPSFIKFSTHNLQWTLDCIRHTQFIVGDSGQIGMPEHLKQLLIPIGGSKYQMGIGGLHSTEKSVAHIASEDMLLLDTDVESFYPRIMINLNLYPPHIGPPFLKVFEGIVNRRIDAKHRKDKVTADALKITINGTYGKLGSKYSFLYAPHQIIQVTLTGQLSLLMLIERLELQGFSVVSANTDGLVTKVPTVRRDHFNAIVDQWRNETNFKTEETQYDALYSRDVNNYVALKHGGGYKGKGVYANPWDAEEPNKLDQLKHNPANLISLEAAIAALRFGTPVEKTVESCKDIRKFISVRTVTGGAVKVWGDSCIPDHSTPVELLEMAGWVRFQDTNTWHGPDMDIDAQGGGPIPETKAYEMVKNSYTTLSGVQYLGKAIRWYYGVGATGELVAAKTGNKVPRSDGAVPLMDLPDEFPSDVDHEWYIGEANKILKAVAYLN